MRKAAVIFTIVALLALALGATAAAAKRSADGPQVEGFKGPGPQKGHAAPSSNRLMVMTDGEVTAEMLVALGNHSRVLGVVHRYNVVVVNPSKRGGRGAIEGLSFVTHSEPDGSRYLSDAGTWDRDIIDVVDVEETGLVGDPDRREVEQNGRGVHVAVIDTGLVMNWRDFISEDKVDTELSRAFIGGPKATDGEDELRTSAPRNLWERDTNSHGIAVVSHVLGFAAGDVKVDGAAPGATVIPLKVFANGESETFSSRIVAAIAYATELRESGRVGPLVINLSLGGGTPSAIERLAIRDAIAAGVIVVASAGNRGEAGMDWPAAYPEVISVGAVGWTQQFKPGTVAAPNMQFWWTQDVGNDPDGNAGGPSEADEVYVTSFSGRAIPGLGPKLGTSVQELDLLAPGLFTVAPGDHGAKAGLFFWGGTSFSSPLVAGAAALLLEKDPDLRQGAVEAVLKSTALPIAAGGAAPGVLDPFLFEAVYEAAWDADCQGSFCDAVGAGLVQPDAALEAVGPG